MIAMQRNRTLALWRIAAVGAMTLSVGTAGTQASVLTARDSRIVEVTVYPDRAEVVREGRVELLAGASSVEFLGIPFQVEADSFRVSAKGVPAVLGAVEIRVRADEPQETPEWLAAREEVTRLEGEVAKLGEQDKVASDLRSFLNSVRASVGQKESENLGTGRADPAAIQGVYELLARNLGELAAQGLARQEARDRLAKNLALAQAKLAAARPAGSIRSRTAAVEVQAQQAGALVLRLAYLVSGASWRPTYKASLDALTGGVALVSEAVVQQRTGEDWSGVSLRLSTAAPARGVEPPRLVSLLLRPRDAMATGGFTDDFEKDLPVPGRFYQNTFPLAPGVSGGDVPSPPPPPPPADSTAALAGVVHSAYNVAFEVLGRSDVPADGADHRVVLRQESLAGKLVYRAVPALNSAAYLTSVTTAPADYPLLAGVARVFAGGAYLGSYGLPETAPGAELTLPFGIDNRIRVQRVSGPQDHSREGISGKTKQVEYRYRTVIENQRGEDITLTLEDRIPVSEDERVVVELGKQSSPGYAPSKTRAGVMLWNLTLAPKAKQEITLEYTVRFPKELFIPGLE